MLDAKDLMQFDDTVFVECFSELPDAVSQWTRYGGGGGLGFDSEKISALAVPQYNHTPGGKVVPVMATIGGGPDNGKQVELTWGAFIQKVRYGDDARDLVIEGLLSIVRRIREVDEPGCPFEQNVANCISQTHALLHQMPLVKHSAYQDEQEHRITITEHHGGASLNQRGALSGLGEPYSYLHKAH